MCSSISYFRFTNLSVTLIYLNLPIKVLQTAFWREADKLVESPRVVPAKLKSEIMQIVTSGTIQFTERKVCNLNIFLSLDGFCK